MKINNNNRARGGKRRARGRRKENILFLNGTFANKILKSIILTNKKKSESPSHVKFTRVKINLFFLYNLCNFNFLSLFSPLSFMLFTEGEGEGGEGGRGQGGRGRGQGGKGRGRGRGREEGSRKREE
jgi:hypothetical protein